jgi:hypothetical protein
MDPVIQQILMMLAQSSNTKSGNKSDLENLLAPALGIFSGTMMPEPEDPRLSDDYIRRQNTPVSNEILAGGLDTLRAQILAMVQRGEPDAAIKNYIDGIGTEFNTDDYFANNPNEPYQSKKDLKQLVDVLKSEQRKYESATLDASIARQSQKSVYAKAGLPEPDAEYPGDPMANEVLAQIGGVSAEASARRLREIEAERRRKESKLASTATGAASQPYRDAGFTDLQQREAELRQEMARALQPGTPNVRSTTEISKDMEELAKLQRTQKGESGDKVNLRNIAIGAGLQAVGGPIGQLIGNIVAPIRTPRKTKAEGVEKGERDTRTPASGYMAGTPSSQMAEQFQETPLSKDDRDYLKLKAFEKVNKETGMTNRDMYMQEAQRLLTRRIQSEQAAQGTGSPLVDALIRRAYVNRLMNG